MFVKLVVLLLKNCQKRNVLSVKSIKVLTSFGVRNVIFVRQFNFLMQHVHHQELTHQMYSNYLFILRCSVVLDAWWHYGKSYCAGICISNVSSLMCPPLLLQFPLPRVFQYNRELVKVDNWGRCCALSHLMCQLSLQHCHRHLGGPFKLSNSLAHSTLLCSVYASLSSSPPPRHPPVTAGRMHWFVSFKLWWHGAKCWMVSHNAWFTVHHT